jgi:hypothetical protein
VVGVLCLCWKRQLTFTPTPPLRLERAGRISVPAGNELPDRYEQEEQVIKPAVIQLRAGRRHRSSPLFIIVVGGGRIHVHAHIHGLETG